MFGYPHCVLLHVQLFQFSRRRTGLSEVEAVKQSWTIVEDVVKSAGAMAFEVAKERGDHAFISDGAVGSTACCMARHAAHLIAATSSGSTSVVANGTRITRLRM